MLTDITTGNFVGLGDLSIKLSPKINIIIGGNGSGKTHLLKAGYALCSGHRIENVDSIEISANDDERISHLLSRLYTPFKQKVGALAKIGTSGTAFIQAEHIGGQKSKLNIHKRGDRVTIEKGAGPKTYAKPPVFIPTKEILSLVSGLREKSSDKATIERIFDETYIDLSNLLVTKIKTNSDAEIANDPRLSVIARDLAKIVGGRYLLETDGFSFESGKYVERARPNLSKSKAAQLLQDSTTTHFLSDKGPILSSNMTAEGFRKIGVLDQLLNNGTLDPGESGPLFWDEPEANLNPKLMKALVKALLSLSRNGQQIILATHDYVLLKWFDLLRDEGQDDHVRFHSLYKDPISNDMVIESADSFSLISKSGISDTFAELYDEDVKRALG